jgi:hypothetical protein
MFAKLVNLWKRHRKEWQIATQLIDVLVAELSQPLIAPNLENSLERAGLPEDERRMVANGYRLRMIECHLFATHEAAAYGSAEEAIMRAPLDDAGRIDALTACLNGHGGIGLGAPLRPHAHVPLEVLQMVAEGLVDSAFAASDIGRTARRLKAFHRHVAEGYAYRVAEELVLGITIVGAPPASTRGNVLRSGGGLEFSPPPLFSSALRTA